MCTISVIIPAYNAEKTILGTISSVLNQTLSDFEIIVIDDGSTDKTVDIVQKIDDPRIKLFTYENSGVSEARNRGITLSKGDFIAFLDSDDQWTPDKLEVQLAALQSKPDYGVAYSWTHFMFYNQPDRSYIENSANYEGDVYKDLLVINFIHSGSNILARREAIESTGFFDESLVPFEDWDYWLRLSMNWKFTLVSEPQILYLQHLGSLSDNLQALEKAFFLTAAKAFDSAPMEFKHLEKRSLAWGNLFLAQQYLTRYPDRLIDTRYAASKLMDAVITDPSILLNGFVYHLIQWCFKKIVKAIYLAFNPNNKVFSSRA